MYSFHPHRRKKKSGRRTKDQDKGSNLDLEWRHCQSHREYLSTAWRTEKTASKEQITGVASVLKVNNGTIYELKVPPPSRDTKEICDILPACARAPALLRAQTHSRRCARLVLGEKVSSESHQRGRLVWLFLPELRL